MEAGGLDRSYYGVQPVTGIQTNVAVLGVMRSDQIWDLFEK